MQNKYDWYRRPVTVRVFMMTKSEDGTQYVSRPDWTFKNNGGHQGGLCNWNQWYVVDDSSRGRYLKSRCGRMIALNLILSSVADYEALQASLKGN